MFVRLYLRITSSGKRLESYLTDQNNTSFLLPSQPILLFLSFFLSSFFDIPLPPGYLEEEKKEKVRATVNKTKRSRENRSWQRRKNAILNGRPLSIVRVSLEAW